MNEWNSIIRHVLFADDELKTLMLQPENTNIITFIDKYFIKSSWTNKLLTDEDVRVVYWFGKTGEAGGSENVNKNTLTFDIFVRADDARNASTDRLLFRTELIAARQQKLLMGTRYVKDTGYRFWLAGEWDGGTRTPGYLRYTIAFNFLKVM